MAKIKNMGTATMRFGEGVIVTGSAGTDIHTLVVTGSVVSTTTITGVTGSFQVIDLDRLALTSNQTTTPPLQLTANSLQDGVGALRIDGSQADIFLNPSTATHTTVTFAVNNDQRLAFGMDNNSDFYITRRTGGSWFDDTLVIDRDSGQVSLGYDLSVAGDIIVADEKTIGTSNNSNFVRFSENSTTYTGTDMSIGSNQSVHILVDMNNDGGSEGGFTVRRGASTIDAATELLKVNSDGVSFGNAYTFPTADGNANQVLTTDGAGNLSFQAAQTGSGAVSPGGLDRHVQFNDNGSFAGNYGILVDSNFNLKVSGSLISKEAIGLGTDLGGGRNTSDEWVAITEPQHKFHVIGNASENADFSIDSASDTVGGAYWTFTKARGTPASPTGINTNDEIARIQFFAHTGSSTLKRSAMIYTTADSDGDGKMAFYVTRNGDQDNKALEFYDNQVKAHDQVVLISGMIPETAGGTSIGATSLPFDYIRGNNIVAFDSFLLGATHPLYDRGGHGITINKDNPILGNYTSGEGLAYISNNSGVENVVFALHKTGSHFAGMSLNGNVTDSDQKLVFFSQYNTAGFEWKNNIPYYNANGMGNLNTTGTSLMSLDSSGNLDIQGNAIVTGSIAVLGDAQITGMPGYILNYDSYADSGSTQSYAATNGGLDFITGSIDGQINTTFTAPPTGNVEIEMNFYAIQTNAGSNLLLALSTNGVTWSTESGTYLRIWDGDETDANYVTAKWGITGLTPGSSYTYYFGATSASPAVPNGVTIYWGRSGQTSVQYPPITIKVTTLP